ncbi:MAG: DUF2461 domain-containing protein [Deltaproteobacteria bacterium]
MAHFNRKFFDFFRELSVENNRTWFNDNKARYESEVVEPMLAFIGDFAPKLKKISPHYLAIPKKTGGSMFRIYRDTRFAKDKTPYKTHGSAHFRHARGKDVHAPGFYLHLEPNEVFMGCGIWHPDKDPLLAIRQRIADDPKAYQRVLKNKKFAEHFELSGSALKRPPKGFDAEHPLIEEIKRKDFIAVSNFSERDACKADFLDRFTERCKAGTPLMKFLATSLEIEW